MAMGVTSGLCAGVMQRKVARWRGEDRVDEMERPKWQLVEGKGKIARGSRREIAASLVNSQNRSIVRSRRGQEIQRVVYATQDGIRGSVRASGTVAGEKRRLLRTQQILWSLREQGIGVKVVR